MDLSDTPTAVEIPGEPPPEVPWEICCVDLTVKRMALPIPTEPHLKHRRKPVPVSRGGVTRGREADSP